MIVYFDTSALVKLVVTESGTGVVTRLWQSADTAVASMIIYPEARAAIGRAHRDGRLDDDARHAALQRLEGLLDRMALVPATRELLWAAGQLAEVHALRSFDAVHLASAVRVRPVRFATADHRLAVAARAARLSVEITD